MARKILLADDSVTAQNMGRRILSDAGYEVSTVNNGSAALKRIAEAKPDLIVLDVYMPGYGGLEVCQRIREAPETARIPVLLTVGKLEPFKPEDARRVRADAYIIKPFEASELLTALTKLEDRIVPQAQPHKPGRFAKAIASIEEAAKFSDFGDTETGWKNRLKIPPPHAKHHEANAETPAGSTEPAVAADHKTADSRDSRSPHFSALPADATPEEIAAIAAAAAALEAQDQPAQDQPSVAQVHPAEDSAIASATASTPEANIPVASAEEVIQASTQAVENDSRTATSASREEASQNEFAVSNEPAAEIPSILAAEEPKGVADEVDAALASLVPTHGNATEENAEVGVFAHAHAGNEITAATMAGQVEQFSGPRWIAEPVPLAEDESTLILEEEMRKAYAAMAAVEAAHFGVTTPFTEPVASDAWTPVSELTAEVPSADISAPSETGLPTSQEAPPEEPVPVQSAVSQIEVQASEATAEPTGAVSDQVDAIKEQAMAAAASMGSADSGVSPQTISYPEAAHTTAETSPPAESSQAELAAAWAQWKQNRDAAAESQVSATNGEAAAPAEPAPATPSTAQESSEATTGNGEENQAIASIVDSLLADLKPKLMEEIARKMGKDSRKK